MAQSTTEHADPMRSTALRFGSARDTLRSEDIPLVTGQGRFTDDLKVPDQAYVAFVRATVAHADIRSVETSAASRMPGVVAVITGRELVAEDIGAIAPVAVFNGRDGRPMFTTRMPVLAAERVRFVGEPVAIVIAETLTQALDAAEKVEVEYDHLPAAADVTGAMAAGAPLVWPEAGGNIALDWEDGDEAAVDAAFARAAHIERVRLFDTRLAVAAMEPRAAIATFDRQTERYTLIAPTQGVAIVRKVLAENVFKVPAEKIRVLTHDVGGGFGMKTQAYAEYAALLCAARRTGRPVRWCATRLESFLTDTAARDGLLEGELALDADGSLSGPARAHLRRHRRLRHQLRGDHHDAEYEQLPLQRVCHPRHPLRQQDGAHQHYAAGPYRGAGRPEAIYLVERLIDGAALGPWASTAWRCGGAT